MASSLLYDIPLSDKPDVKKLILIDTSWVVHRMWHAHKGLSVTLSTGEVLRSGHVYGLCRLLLTLSGSYPDADIVLCLDGYAERGKSLCSEYKANRKSGSSYSAFDDIGVLVELAVAYGVGIAFHRDLEADEVISFLAHRYHGDYDETVIYSADGDMLQLLALDGVSVARELKDQKFVIVNKDTCMEDNRYLDKFLGIPPERLPMFRALVGDSSDNLPGFYRLRKKLALELATTFDSVEELCAACLFDAGSFPSGFDEFLPQFCINHKIMKLPAPTQLLALRRIPKYYRTADHKTLVGLLSLYRIKSVHPLYVEGSDGLSEVERLNLRDEVNSRWHMFDGSMWKD